MIFAPTPQLMQLQEGHADLVPWANPLTGGVEFHFFQLLCLTLHELGREASPQRWQASKRAVWTLGKAGCKKHLQIKRYMR